MSANNTKSDVKAKEAFVKKLEERGFTDVRIVKAPSDIIAKKDDREWYFEIKMTRQSDRYFGAATLTEWEQAFKTPDTYRFIVAAASTCNDEEYEFFELTPNELMKYSSVPPGKVYFNLRLTKLRDSSNIPPSGNKNRKSIRFTEKSFEILQGAFSQMRSKESECNVNDSL